MTNTELLNYKATSLLGGLERQRQFLLRQFSMRALCPCCGTSQNIFEAAGVSIDEYDVTVACDTHSFKCVNEKCGVTLLYILPFMGPWFWRRDFNKDGVQ